MIPHAVGAFSQLGRSTHHVKRFRRREVPRVFRPEFQSVGKFPLHLIERQEGVVHTRPRATYGQ